MTRPAVPLTSLIDHIADALHDAVTQLVKEFFEELLERYHVI